MKKVDLVLDLGFGDSGKGKTVDWLASQDDPKNTIVVRFSGGQQCGHTVINENGKHTHASFPSGTLRGADGYISEHCTIHPGNIRREFDKLSKIVEDFPKLMIHPLAKVTTLYDVLYGQARERILRHGSCGQGVGATMMRHENTPYKLYARELSNHWTLREKLKSIKIYYDNKVANKLDSESQNYYYESLRQNSIEEYMDHCHWLNGSFISMENYSTLYGYDNVIFEGSQGILLDMDHGVFPFVTYANTTSKNVWDILEKDYISICSTYYVTRGYLTRHGNGPMPNQRDLALKNTEEEVNVGNEWQGNFRTGELDLDLLKYSMNVDSIYNKSVEYNLCVTCLDQIEEKPDFSDLEFLFNKFYISFTPKSIFNINSNRLSYCEKKF